MKAKEHVVYAAAASSIPKYDVTLDQYEINHLSKFIRLGKKEILKDYLNHKKKQDEDFEKSDGYLGMFEDRVIEQFSSLDRLEETLKTGRRVLK